MKKIFLFLIAFYISFHFFTVKASVRNNIRNEIRNGIMPTISAIKEEIKPTISAIREQKKEQIKEILNLKINKIEKKELTNKIREENRGLLDRIKNQVKEKLQDLKFSARFEGKITGLSDNLINVIDDNGKTYNVKITEKTQLRLRFWGKAKLSEFTIGNRVKVIGRYLNDDKTEVEAVLIRNLSIQKRWGVFFGEVKTVSENYLVIKTVNWGDLTVYLTNETKLENRKEERIKLNEIQTGHRIRVKGIWNKDLGEIRNVEEIKDFSLPPIVTISK